jgi:hypothetical protein
MTWVLAVVAMAAFSGGTVVGYGLARAVLLRFLADSLATLKTAPASPPEPTTYESPALVPVIRATRSPFGPTHRRLPLA